MGVLNVTPDSLSDGGWRQGLTLSRTVGCGRKAAIVTSERIGPAGRHLVDTARQRA
jgi:dihydropteroate synthase